MKFRKFLPFFVLYFFLVSIVPFSHCHADEITHHEAAAGAKPAEIPTQNHENGHEAISDEPGEYHDDQGDFHFHFLAENLCSSLRQCPIKALLSNVMLFASLVLPITEVDSKSQCVPENPEEPPILRDRICSKRHSGLSPPSF